MSAVNLASDLDRLPAATRDVLARTGRLAEGRGERLYLVGGVVRDLLLGNASVDLDMVVEGDAPALAEALAKEMTARVVVHRRFGTATMQVGGFRLDFVTARSETYDRPGALPEVKPGGLREDLFRRDFTINAMAIDLSPGMWGALIDYYGGWKDVEARLVRVLHPRSFIDDATRIWRAIRYEQRLGFRIEDGTLRLLRRDIRMLDTISGDRLRHEIELVLREERPERMLRRAAGLGVLRQVHPSLKGHAWWDLKFARARALGLPAREMPPLYFSLMAYRLGIEEAEVLLDRLNSPGALRRLVADVLRVRDALPDLPGNGAGGGELYRRLRGYQALALRANAVAGSPAVRWYLELFLRRLSRVKPVLSGEDVMALGVPLGPDVGRVLERLREARLEGWARTRRDEEDVVREWLISSRASS